MTVLQSLDRYYDRMATRQEAQAPGFSRERIGFRVVLSAAGEPVAVVDLRERVGKKLVAPLLDVPAALKRTVAVLPNRLWDKTAYALGRTAGSGARTATEHAAFKVANLTLIAGSTDPALSAFRAFLETWLPERFDAPPFRPEMLDANIVFALDGDRRTLHEGDAALERLKRTEAADGPSGQPCLVTGITGPVARLHPSIKGVWGAQSAGAALVSFNLDAFESYGKKQGDNAPTSEAAAFRYGAALNRMLDSSSRNRLPRPVGDAMVVFWADTSMAVDEAAARAAEDIFAAILDTPPDDASEARHISDSLALLAEGRPIQDLHLGLVKGTRFHVLGLSPNAARVSVRFWLTDDFEIFARRLARHHQALHIEPTPWRTPPSLSRLLVRTTAVQEKFENIPPALAGEAMRALLAGAPYPRTWLTAAIIRLRAGDDPGTGWHAAVIKACLLHKETVPVSLDPDFPKPAYQLGRLFAVLEAAQREALGRVNASIADRYYAAASSTPARVFGTLLRGARTHVSAAEKLNKGFWITRRLEGIMANLPPELPRTLRLEDQGLFAIGYYHERAFRPAKAESPDPTPQEST